MASNPIVTPVGEGDFPAVAAFAARFARPGEAVAAEAMKPLERLRWLLLENPARSDDIPFGWCARDDNSCAIAAMLLCVPFRVGMGDFRCTALMASKFYADPNYRGAGIGPLMRFLQQGDRFPLLMTSANAVAGELYRKCGAYQIEGMDHTMLGVRRVGPLAEEWFFRRSGNRWAARVLSGPAALLRKRVGRGSAGAHLIPLEPEKAGVSPFRPRADLLAVLRDAAYLRWRYFGAERGKDVYTFSAPGREDRLVVTRLIRSGHRSQIRVLEVLDLWPPADLQIASPLVGTLADRYAGAFDVIWLRSQGDVTELALAEIGFVRHAFPAPLGWCIDRAGLLPGKRWYLMPGESE
jgi:GNAT superfamily N-acetyltransferase